MALPPHPDFGWSWSRHRLYATCPRRYWIKVYLAWQGWDAPPGSPSQTAYRLSKLLTFPQLVGTLVHEALREIALAAAGRRALPEFQTLWAPAWTRLRAVREASRAEFLRDPKSHPMLADAYYGSKSAREISDDLQDAGDTLAACLANALELPLWDELKTALRVRPPDELDRSTVSVLGDPGPVQWWGAPDLAFIDADRIPWIVDYKTGAKLDEMEATRQIHVYAAWMIACAEARWTPQWRGRIIDLREGGRETVITIRQQDVFDAFTAVEADVRRWRASQVTREPNQAEMAAFPLTEDRRLCPWCAFVGLCQELNNPGGTSGSPRA